jgi:hypothetical protein
LQLAGTLAAGAFRLTRPLRLRGIVRACGPGPGACRPGSAQDRPEPESDRRTAAPRGRSAFSRQESAPSRKAGPIFPGGALSGTTAMGRTRMRRATRAGPSEAAAGRPVPRTQPGPGRVHATWPCGPGITLSGSHWQMMITPPGDRALRARPGGRLGLEA